MLAYHHEETQEHISLQLYSNMILLIQENAIENVSKMSAIWFKPAYVTKSPTYSQVPL